MNNQIKYILIFISQFVFITLVIRYITGGYWIPDTKEVLVFRLLWCLMQTQFIWITIKIKAR
jgi:hypothetical protein